MLVASFGHWLNTHPAYADWGVALGTLFLASATCFLAVGALREAKKVGDEVDISRASLEAQVRPILIDVAPREGHVEQEAVNYYPGVADTSRAMSVDAIHMDAVAGTGHFMFSVPLRNAGAGLAFVTGKPRLTHPDHDGDLIGAMTKHIVPAGEQTRAYFAPGIGLETNPEATLRVKIPYNAASESLSLWTEATIKKSGNAWRIVGTSIQREGDKQPLAVSGDVD